MTEHRGHPDSPTQASALTPAPAAAGARPSSGARPSARKRPGFLPTALASLACFLVLFEFLAFRLQAGNDPALGPQVASTQAPKDAGVLNRRIIERRVVHLPPSGGSAPAASSSVAPPSAASAPTQTTAPAIAPAPATTPAPAPATAAPVTSSS